MYGSTTSRLLSHLLVAAVMMFPTLDLAAQRRRGSQIGPVTFHLLSDTRQCLQIGAGIRMGSCAPTMTNEQAFIYDAEFSLFRSAANPNACVRVDNLRAGAQLTMGDCSAGQETNRAWIFHFGMRVIRPRDDPDMCARPDGGVGSTVSLAPCAESPARGALWGCTPVEGWAPLDGGVSAERVGNWCGR